MLAVIRLFLLGLFVVLVGVLGCLFCLLRPFHRDNTHIFANLFGHMHKVIGVEMDIRVPDTVRDKGPFVYVANHQNSWDMFTMSGALPAGTVSVGKKSLKWIPFFGQLYWLAGNILIDRNNRSKAHGTIGRTIEAITKNKLSIWLFPEGTRSYGRGLLKFKTGAFHSAVGAGVPLVPVCMSTTHGQIKLNRWNNGKVIIEMLEPIETTGMNKEDIRALMATTHEAMSATIERLDKDVEENWEAKK
ncbi:1-acyl-sn-glycerol-3-phosphate acyltransferase [Aliidiomarina taiwanensis]|uniref:1-acyl-sn-glycerol-3-phosphate acyltransferase n=1 Tax=Aliidiomarina taiwanensis TaxID=946228 RepID=A0A432WZS9_9GAMM|nr:1-acylglycerol-3-phosphate O-acyltransferase [Aliidiomarina taiwanensis]RUO39321.1 1-acyl-sn-glycerol-3-phosphate acyltransferase [Aliidiomarina taiwanensis]